MTLEQAQAETRTTKWETVGELGNETFLRKLTLLANKAAYAVLGYRDSCILTSNALRHVLIGMGGDAKIVRVTCGIFPEDRKYYGAVLGSDGDGTFRPAAEPGMWKGHVVVTLGREWLLDPTLDQANKPEWPEDICVHPVAVRLDEQFWQLEERPWQHHTMFFKSGTTTFRYNLYHKQTGFLNAGDARPSHWRPVADLMLAMMQSEEEGSAIPPKPTTERN
jgi:hypothetical protein